jgi:hypothetical protein
MNSFVMAKFAEICMPRLRFPLGGARSRLSTRDSYQLTREFASVKCTVSRSCRPYPASVAERQFALACEIAHAPQAV